MIIVKFIEFFSFTEFCILICKIVGQPHIKGEKGSMKIVVPQPVRSFDDAKDSVLFQHVPGHPQGGNPFFIDHMLKGCKENNAVEGNMSEAGLNFCCVTLDYCRVL